MSYLSIPYQSFRYILIIYNFNCKSLLSPLTTPTKHSHERQKQLRIGLLNQSTSLQERCSPPFKALHPYLASSLSILHTPSGFTIGDHQKRERKLSHVHTSCDGGTFYAIGCFLQLSMEIFLYLVR